MAQSKKDIAFEALVDLRNQGYGADTWMASDSGRLIARSHFGKKASLIEQVILIEEVRKKGLLKSHTGNVESATKGGKKRKRANKIPRLADETCKVIEENMPDVQSARSSWLNTEEFTRLCSLVPGVHQGEIIREFINIAKKWRKNRIGVYFNRDPLRPNEYNIGYTARGSEERLRDTGSKGRHWRTEAFVKESENEIHNLLKPWHDKNGRGAETYQLDDKARELIFHTYKIRLP